MSDGDFYLDRSPHFKRVYITLVEESDKRFDGWHCILSKCIIGIDDAISNVAF